MKSRGINAAAWFYGQSFNGRIAPGNYLVIDRVTKRFHTYELRWGKAYSEFDVVTLTADGDWLSTVSFDRESEAEARREFERISR